MRCHVRFFALLVAVSSTYVSAQSSTALPTADSGVSSSSIALPKTCTVYASDGKANKPLMQLHATEIVSNSHAAGNFVGNQVFLGGRASVELPGLNAAIHLSDPRPVLFVRINSDDPELVRQRIHLIRLDQTRDRRVVTTYSQNIFGGQRAKKFNDIAVTKTDAEQDVWLQITPVAPLPAGEYGVVFMPKDSNLGPDAVYDFDLQFDSATPDPK